MLESMIVTSPINDETLADVPEHTAADTRAAFERARRAQQRWAETPISQRRKIMYRYHDLVLARQDEIMDVIQGESGKARKDAHEEILDSAITARHYANRAAALLKPRTVRPTLPIVTTTHVEHVPVGVVGVIAPWNYPLVLAVSDGVAALMAGNAVVLKPDSNTPLSALRAAELLHEAGLDPDLFQVITGSGTVVGQEIVAQCDYLMFTGSTATGRTLAAQASERLIGFSAELGGKNPMIVAPDADIAKAAAGAVTACFSNAGQLCISIERIYLHREIANEFLERFLTNIKAMRVDGSGEWGVDMGSLISAGHHEKIAELVDDAVSKGALVLTGGKSLGGNFYAPTVLADVPGDAILHREEVFGPVVYVEVVDTLDEAVAQANDTEYGLNASIWAQPATGRALASRIHAGTVNVNEGYSAAWISMHAPMGGWKASGVGRRHGDGGLLKYTEERTIAVQRFMAISGPENMARETFASVAATALRVGKRFLP